MDTLAVVMEAPERLSLSRLELSVPGSADVVVDVEWSGISTGTERLLWTGKMPPFPGLGYPLVPGYESVGRVVEAGPDAGVPVGARVFVPGASCFGPVRGLFGGAASRLVVAGARVTRIPDPLAERGVLLALAATAMHAIVGGAPAGRPERLPELVVGHGVLGRLLARITVAMGGAPMVWETNPARRAGADGYAVIAPSDDARRDYRAIQDVSGDASILDTLVGRSARGAEIVLAGFYDQPLHFAFAPAFIKESRIRVAAEWQPADLVATLALVESGRLSLDGLITHTSQVSAAPSAYVTAFTDPSCLKMILDWRARA
jgi:3-hydroxyethyl bacteriochlorophyllide a dehydrogenase